MKLNKYMKGALIGAILSAGSVIAGKANAADIDASLGADYSPAVSAERNVKDVSPVMTVDSKDKIKTDELSIGAGLGMNNIKNSGIGVTLEDSMIRQNGSLARDSTVFETIKISEEGNYSRLRNTLKAITTFKGFGAGLAHLIENEKRDYTQHTTLDNKITTEQSLQAIGPMARIPFNYKGPVNIGFNTDFSYFPKGNETYNLAFEDKSLPGDVKFERKRELSSMLSETSVTVAKPFENEIFNEVGIRAWVDYFFKKIKQKETTETYMPVYEDYKDTRLRYGAELFTRIKKYFSLKLGVKQEQHKSAGTLETNDSQTRIYGGAEAYLNF